MYRQRLSVAVADNEAGVQFLDSPRRREVAVGHCAINQSLNF